MAYADYKFYKDTFLGVAIAEADFPRFALRASEEVDSLTKGRAEDYHATNPLPIQKATCAVAEVLFAKEKNDAALQLAVTGRGIMTSESVGGESYGYNTASIDVGGWRTMIISAAAKYLQRTGLLFAGVSTC